MPWLLHPPPPYSSSYAYTHTYILSWIGHDRCLQVFVMNHEFFFRFFSFQTPPWSCIVSVLLLFERSRHLESGTTQKVGGGRNNFAGNRRQQKMNAHTVNPRCELKTFLHWDKMKKNRMKNLFIVDFSPISELSDIIHI